MVNSSSSKGSLVAQSLAVSPHGAVQQGALFLSVGHLYITIVFAMAPQGALQVERCAAAGTLKTVFGLAVCCCFFGYDLFPCDLELKQKYHF